MSDIMSIGGHVAAIEYDEEIQLFHGEFIDLRHAVHFYAADAAGLEYEGITSLRVFLECCRANGVDPYVMAPGHAKRTYRVNRPRPVA